ncbi:MAG: hypothetical protein EB117_16315 [Betaproteobacteria bacterium]|nr:hypothetical protein [Betaproteobacteria bacterium]
MICFMALILYRVMRQRLKIAQSSLSPERLSSTVWRVDFEKASCFQWFGCLLGCCCNGTFRRSGY